MRKTLTAIMILSIIFMAACGGKKPQDDGLEVEQFDNNSGSMVTERPGDDTMSEEDLTDTGPADDRIDFDQGQGIEERALENMDIEEINAAEFLENIYFEFDQYDLTDSAIEQLQQNGQWLLENPSVKVIIEGHCDERGTEEYNIALGERRANSAREFLIRMGIDPSRMTTVSYGESRPMRDEANEIAWSMNRRCHFRVYAR